MSSTLRHPVLRLLIVTCAIVAYLAVWVGVMPSPATIGSWIGVQLSHEQRYPCEDHQCGCASATECWTSCCCHDDVERLAWAMANGVSPPEGVVFSEATWLAAANANEPGSATCSLCVEVIEENLLAGSSGSTDENASGDRLDERVEPVGRSSGVMTAAGCKGLSQLLLLAMVPARWSGALSWDVPEPDTHKCVDLFFAIHVPVSRYPDVPTPPPRMRADTRHLLV